MFGRGGREGIWKTSEKRTENLRLLLDVKKSLIDYLQERAPHGGGGRVTAKNTWSKRRLGPKETSLYKRGKQRNREHTDGPGEERVSTKKTED